MRGPGDERRDGAALLDVRLAAGASWRVGVPADKDGFVVPVRGRDRARAPRRSATRIERSHAAVLGEGDAIELRAIDSARVLVVAGRPIREPVARYGPFVMNTREELEQAFRDFERGTLAS